MAHPNAALIQKMWDLFAAGDLDGVRSQIFSDDVKYNMPGHHPIAGQKVGIDEVMDFFKELQRSNVQVDLLKLGELGEEYVVEVHHGHGTVKGATLDVVNCSVYHVRDGKCFQVDCYNGDQHAIDNFFCAVYAFKPLPEAIAGTILE